MQQKLMEQVIGSSYGKLLVPMAKPSIITICILVGINSWNAFLWPLLVTNSDKYEIACKWINCIPI